jgi:hypothetical protein
MNQSTVELPNGAFITLNEVDSGIDIDLVDKRRHIFDRVALRSGTLLFVDARSREEIDTVIAHLREVEDHLPLAVRRVLTEKKWWQIDMNLLKLFRARKTGHRELVTAKDDMTKQSAPRSLPIKTIAMTGDPYVDDCFQIDFDEFYEERDWFNIPEAKAIAEAGNAGLIDEALRLTADLRQKYPDFYFCYYWFAILYRKQKRYDDARKSLMEGLHFAKSKESLCAKMGDVEWEVHDLHQAVKWWIKSIAIQLGSQSVTDDDGVFLSLSYVAEALGMIGVCSKLRSWADRLRLGQIRLNAQPANDIYLATSRQATPAMRLAIELLDKHYLNKLEE